MMSHSFVGAELLPSLPGWARYGQTVLASFTTKPFLALHIQLPTEDDDSDDDDSDDDDRAPNLFVVSTQQPASLDSQYFVLNQSESDETNVNARSLTVLPPLPFKGPLYLFVTPRICASFRRAKAYQRLAYAERYQLDDVSLERFLNALKDARPSIPATRNTGGNDEPASRWGSWSGDSPGEFMMPGVWDWRRELQFYFDLVPFHSLPTDLGLHVFDELPLLRQLILDYTWPGGHRATRYVKSIRKTRDGTRSDRIICSPVLPTRQPDFSVDALLSSTRHLPSLPVENDDDHADEKKDTLTYESSEDEETDFIEAVPVPAVHVKNIKLIVLDPNVLIDRDGPLKDALTHIFPPSQYHFAPKKLLHLYVEYETLRAADGQPDSATAIIQDIARYLSISVDKSAIDTALKHRAQPRIFPEISAVIAGLIKHGYLLLVLPFFSPSDLALLTEIWLPRRLSLSLPTSSPGPWKWEYLSQHYPTLGRKRILVVTSDIYRIAEPASLAGFPTAFIKRARSRNARLSIPTTPPTFTFSRLSKLPRALRNPASVKPPQSPVKPRRCWPFRIHDCYQVTFRLGSGSFSDVYNGIQLHTGACVAIKVEPNPKTLLYEAAIYAQLRGVPGVPRIHWSGKTSNAYVIVMDKLGSNLEQLRKVCRGRFGLRTVIMIGEQMLSIIEEIHAHGIIVRDIKPHNVAMGLKKEYKILHLFDFGLGKPWFDPTTGKHIPFHRGYYPSFGTARYASHNAHFGFELSRRDDIESIGFLLLYLLHGQLPWQGIYAANVRAKLRRFGEMKLGKPFADLLAQENTPKFFTKFFKHCRSLAFEEKPDYRMLRGLLKKEFEDRGWGEYDWEYDWCNGNGDVGTLVPGEYRLDARLVEPVRHEQLVL